MFILSPSRRRLVLEVAAIAFLATLSIHLGLRALEHWSGPALTLTNELYIPAAMFAHGHGFINPPLDEVPGLHAFLYWIDGVQSWEPESLPEEFSRTELDAYQKYHRYLIYGMGLVWRIFGVSWPAAKIFVIAVYMASVLAAYALMRNGMGPVLAACGAAVFAFTPVLMYIVFNVREISKAPFILGLIALLLYTARERRSRRDWFLLCAAMGLLVGIGLGFRRDLLICPPAVFGVLMIAPRFTRFAVADRLGGLAVFAVTLLIAAAPILESFRESGALVYHDIMMGTASVHDGILGLPPATYEKIPVKQDLYVSNAGEGLAWRLMGNPTEPAVGVGTLGNPTELLFWHTFGMFPADFITRAYQAVIRILYGVQMDSYAPTPGAPWNQIASVPILEYTHAWGPWHAIAALLLLAVFRLRAAIVAGALLIYFGGLTSLQYEARHAFHMLAAAYGLLLLPAGMLTRCPPWRWPERLREADRPLRTGVLQLAAFLVASLLVLGLPLQIARAMQRSSVGAYIEAIESAPKTKLTLKEDKFEYGPLYMPDPPLPDDPNRLAESDCVPLSEYLMLELEGFTAPMPIWIAYESMGGHTDYGGMMRAWLQDDSPPEVVRYYFPISNYRCGRGWSRFAGVSVAAQYGDVVRGLYRVHAEEIPLHLNVSVGEGVAPQLAQRVSLESWERTRSTNWEFDVPIPDGPHEPVRQAAWALQLFQVDEAREHFEGFEDARLFPMEALQMEADLLHAEDRRGAWLRKLAEGMSRWPLDLNLAINLHYRLLSDLPYEEHEGVWASVTKRAPESFGAWFMRAHYLESRGMHAEALDAYERAYAIADGQFGMDQHVERARLRAEQAEAQRARGE